MNIWLNPDKLRAYGLSASQVLKPAVRGQNVQFSAGRSAAEPRRTRRCSPPRCRRKGASTPQEFENILLRTNDGAAVRLKDVARVGRAVPRTAST